jgi:tetratricopeptide (TPR) repeat protein
LTGSGRFGVAVFAAFTTAAASVGAIFVRPDVENVPVARLVSNIERELAANPANTDLYIHLARLYGMAYAANTEELPVRVTGVRQGAVEKKEVWFGHEPTLIPYRVEKVPDGVRTSASKAYLQKSLDYYRKALEFNGTSLLGRLGYAWALEQSGDKAGAILQYRRVIEQAWPKEESRKFANLGERFYTQEAAGYLIPLLDPQRDAAEIAELQARVQRLGSLPRPITPIAIPLSGTATVRSIVDLDAKVWFDADGSGHRRQWTWITPDAGWLVYDAKKSGHITSALQWFGNVTFWLFWSNGYDALTALDDDRDGELTGAELRYLAIWHDADRDGVSSPGEVRPVADHGIVALSCRSTPADGFLIAALSGAGVRLRDGRTRPSYDVIVRPSRSVSLPAPD